MPDFAVSLVSLGRFGVQLFFALSGLLLISIYRVGERQTWSPRQYSIRRFGRIYPLYFFFAVVWMLLVGAGLSVWEPMSLSIPLVAATLLLVNDLWWVWAWGFLPGAWSISAEVVHYTLFPVLRTLRYRVLICILALSVLVSTAVGAWAYLETAGSYAGPDGAYWSWINTLAPWNTVPYFLAGVVVGLTPTLWGGDSIVTRSLAARVWVLVTAIACMAFTAMVGAVTAVVVLGVVSVLVLIGAPIWRPPSVVQWIGRRSYGTYFTHFLLIALLGAFELRIAMPRVPLLSEFAFLVVVLIVLFASSALSQLLFKVLEGPAIRLSIKWSNRPLASDSGGTRP